MSDLISRQAAVEAADKWDGGYNYERQLIIEEALARIPSAERKKGKWIVDDVETEHCSVCKHSFYISALFAVGGNDEPPSCPWCGADMRGDNDE